MTDTTLDLFGVTGAVVMAGRRDESRAAAQMADSVKPVESSALAFNPPLPVTAPSEPPRYAPAVVLAAIAPAALPSAPVDLPVFKAPAAAKPDATKPKVHGAIDDPDGAEAALQAASHLVKPGETLGKLLRQAYGSARRPWPGSRPTTRRSRTSTMSRPARPCTFRSGRQGFVSASRRVSMGV